jgi:hypothetical protein
VWVDPPSAIAHTRSERRDLTAGGATPSLRKRVGINNATRARAAIAQVGSLSASHFHFPFVLCPTSQLQNLCSTLLGTVYAIWLHKAH